MLGAVFGAIALQGRERDSENQIKVLGLYYENSLGVV